MTIAIGYRCYGGVIVAADTLVVIGQEAHEGSKLRAFWTQFGSFAFVDASDDANATKSLLLEIEDQVTSKCPADHQELGKTIKTVMAQWRKGFGSRKPPNTSLIVGCKLKGEPEPGLFLCEPPNTSRPIDDYIGVGGGASVTDFIHRYLFSHLGGEYIDVQAVLRRIAYMLYRAKKDTIVCGKNTHAAVVYDHRRLPTLVHMEDLAFAEEKCGNLDPLLSSVAEFAFDSTAENMKTKLEDAMDMLRLSSIRDVKFREDRSLDEISIWTRDDR